MLKTLTERTAASNAGPASFSFDPPMVACTTSGSAKGLPVVLPESIKHRGGHVERGFARVFELHEQGVLICGDPSLGLQLGIVPGEAAGDVGASDVFAQGRRGCGSGSRRRG